MKKWFVALAFTQIVLSVSGQLLTSDELMGKIVLLIDQKKHSGTGFIISSDLNYFLVTAKHVADSLEVESAQIHFRDSITRKAVSYKIKDLIRKNSYRVFNDNSDFYILQLFGVDSASKQRLMAASLDINTIARNRDVLPRNINLIAFGYPIFDLDHFSPITFQSHVSSGLMNFNIPGMNKPCFCYTLENPSMQGFSGGPVFGGVKDRMNLPMNKTFIMGIVTGTTSDATGGKFAIISPSFHLVDLIRSNDRKPM